MGYDIPLFKLNYGIEEEEAVIKTLRSRWISTGPRCQELEEILSGMLGSRFGCTVTNCTAGLHLACLALDIGSGDEVLCPSLTFAATANAIRYTGARPVFCDITNITRPVISPEEIEAKITKKTKAIMVMHYGGFPCDMSEIMRIARQYDLRVIEDACHGPLSEYDGKKVGTFGDIGCFSFFSNKNISCGEGGIIVTDDEKIYNKIKLLRTHGMTALSYQKSTGHATEYDIVDMGYNYRLDDIRASLAIAQLSKLAKNIEERRLVRTRYISRLLDQEKIEIPFCDWDTYVSNYIFAIVLKDGSKEKRNFLRMYLKEQGIETSVHYPCVHKFSIYNKYSASLPVSEYYSNNEITLPMYGSLTEHEIEFICITLEKGLKKAEVPNNES